MKFTLLLAILLTSSILFAQTDKKQPEPCEVSPDFEEPQRTKKILKWEKRMNKFNDGSFPTIQEIKEQVAIENDVDIKNVFITRMVEQTGNGTYNLCVDGKKMKYKRMGTVMMKNGTNRNIGF